LTFSVMKLKKRRRCVVMTIKIFKTKELVLKVNKNYDPARLNLEEWDAFLDVLCGEREFQKEAIRIAIIYLASGLYEKIEDLINENYSKNSALRERYRTVTEYKQRLQLPSKLAANIDLATGTGKSYVIYGIAQIMLGLGLVDKVLVLCPSLTIEKGLTEKFESLSGWSILRNTIPDATKWKNPRINNADTTIKDGDICIENIHAAYERTGSSIHDSLIGVGERTLVLNDEAHHVYNKVEVRSTGSMDIKRWKEFLLNPDYGFRYILGFTGTAFIDDEYFNDCLYRYSLRDAVEAGVVKLVDYVSESDGRIDDNVKFQLIYDNHREKQLKYSKVKPITIFVTKDINNAKKLAEKLKDFLAEWECVSKEEIERSHKVSIVTSHSDHKANVAELGKVDDKDNPVEWIISVAMLTEGWDVKNVFQIVPWVDKAFNSKLLIAQVLGRGLRLPPEYQSPQPIVTVFNHASWSANIAGLVEEVLEVETKLHSNVLQIGERSKYNFCVYNINYDRRPQEIERKDSETRVYNYKDFIELEAQSENIDIETGYIDIKGGVRRKKTRVAYNTWSIDEVVNQLLNELRIREWEGAIFKLDNETYDKERMPSCEVIRKLISDSMNRRGITSGRLTANNKQRVLKSFNTLLRKGSMTIIYTNESQCLEEISTALNMRMESLSVGNLKHDCTVYYSNEYENEIFNKDCLEVLKEVINDQSMLRSASKEINTFKFKTALDIVFTSMEPEREFVKLLCNNGNVEAVTSWMKSRDSGFYSISYSIREGNHPKQKTFNPDFFIRVDKDGWENIIVVEIKADNDDSNENKQKYKYANQHFDLLNEELFRCDIKQKYFFHFVHPSFYNTFFEYLRDGRLIAGNFKSALELLLEQNGSVENGEGFL